MGGLKDFREGAPVAGDYSFTISGTTVQVSGATGGVGFLIHDSNGELIGFANDPVFEVSEAAAEKIRAGEFTFDVVSPDNSTLTVVDAVHDGTLAQRIEALDVLLGKAKEVLGKSDPAGLNPGFLRPEYMADLQSVYDDVKSKRDKGEVTEDNNVELYDALHVKYLDAKDVEVTEEKTIPVTPGGIYVFTSNLQYTGKGIKANDKGTHLSTVAAEEVDLSDEAQQWVFEAAGEDGYYFIRNVKFNKYIGKAPNDKGIVTLVDEPMKQLVVFREFAGFSISPEGSDHDSLHDDGYNRLTRWDSSTKGSRWTLTMVADWEKKGALLELMSVLGKAETLLEDAGTVEETAGGITAEPSAEYQFVTAEMLINLYKAISEGKGISEKGNEADLEEIRKATESLSSIYEDVKNAMNRNADRLSDLIRKTGDLAELIGTFTEEISPVTLNGDLLYSNAPHTGSGSDKFTSWDVLFDDNADTFFHSNYDNRDTSDGLDHYIRIELPESLTEDGDMVLSYVTRKANDSNWYPAEVTLESSADGETWDVVAELAGELPFQPAAIFTSSPFALPAGTRFVRFMVNKNRQSATNGNVKKAGGHCFFVVSGLSLSRYGVSCTIRTDEYPTADEETYRKAVRQLQISRQAMEWPRYSNPDYDLVYEALLPHYEALKSIYDNRVDSGVDEISTDDIESLEDAVIFNLNGVRIRKITEPGFYIINGRKYLIR